MPVAFDLIADPKAQLSCKQHSSTVDILTTPTTVREFQALQQHLVYLLMMEREAF
jgi:hypothetical protein